MKKSLGANGRSGGSSLFFEVRVKFCTWLLFPLQAALFEIRLYTNG